jgi:hypothetical protein
MNQTEMLSATLLTSVVLAAGIGVYQTGIKNNARNLETEGLIASEQRTLQVLERDTLEALSATTASGFATGSALVLNLPIWDANGTMTGSYDQVIVHLEGTELKRQVIPGTGSSRAALEGQVLLRNVSDAEPIFRYYESGATSLTEVSDPADAQVVKVSLRASSNWNGSNPKHASAYLQMRNRSILANIPASPSPAPTATPTPAPSGNGNNNGNGNGNGQN